MHVTIENFQSLASVSLDLQGLTVITGPSDRGKSSLVRAISAALFNTPGEHFVRTGAKTAKVILQWSGAPVQSSAVHSVVWEKGVGKNQFTLDGVVFAKVGTKVPPELLALGFTDLLIGARQKEDGSMDGGTWIRPQIASQFDPIYLLERPGTFINEVVVRLSRLGVLQRAERQCALDLRSAKSSHKTREGDLVVATKAAEVLAPALALKGRLDTLKLQDEALDDARRKVAWLRDRVDRRKVALARASHTLPVIEAERTATVLSLSERYRQLLAVRVHVERRAKLVLLPKKLVKSEAGPDSKLYGQLRAEEDRWQTLAQKVGARQLRIIAVQQAESALQRTQDNYVAAQRALVEFRRQYPTCPVCAQPWASPVDISEPAEVSA